MSGIIVGSAAAALITTATIVIAMLSHTQALLSPLTQRGNEYAVSAVSIMISLQMLALLIVLSVSDRE